MANVDTNTFLGMDKSYFGKKKKKKAFTESTKMFSEIDITKILSSYWLTTLYGLHTRASQEKWREARTFYWWYSFTKYNVQKM